MLRTLILVPMGVVGLLGVLYVTLVTIAFLQGPDLHPYD